MELKVWVDGVQRIVCGVTEFTTCQEVVIALAQAIGRTGRYTLIEKWRDTERHLSPQENPVVSLNKWGQYASDVQLILQRTGPSASERPTSEGPTRVPERGFYRQSLPPLAKLRPSAADRSLRRKEPKRKSLTFSGGARGLREIFGRSKDSEGVTSAPASPSRELSRLVQLQRDRLQALGARLEGCEGELRDWEEATGEATAAERNEAELEEQEFWTNEFQIEQDTEQNLRLRLSELQARLRDTEDKLKEYLAHVQTIETSLEQERQKQELWFCVPQAQAQLEKVRLELVVQAQHSTRLESSCRALERSLSQASRRLQEKEQELEQLTKELRQVNLQQFIQQTGTKVTVLPAQPALETGDESECGSLKRLGPSRLLPGDLLSFQSPVSSSFNPEGIYV
uniref:Ras association domain family member 8b n=1 Tax=Neogobius melanostomus TaxID=47308 RepID=A0A8C6UVA0_9GOBI